MPKIKICGIRRQQDISYVNKYLPEYIGFIFAESKRRVFPDTAAKLVEELDPKIAKVGVFVNESIDTVVSVSNECCLDVVQIHGDETPQYIVELKEKLYTNNPDIKVWKAIRVKDSESLAGMKEYEVDAYVLDSFVEGSYGGSGKTFDWNLAREARSFGKVVLAGGLDSYNAWQAVAKVQPCIIDISSGVETDGYKDENKIREFINTVR
ncbi:MAG TPA: phosphoribosylanthranilate isomerase, partial [Clostridia bacterium]